MHDVEHHSLCIPGAVTGDDMGDVGANPAAEDLWEITAACLFAEALQLCRI